MIERDPGSSAPEAALVLSDLSENNKASFIENNYHVSEA